jgi:hypothetical protein
MLTQRDLDDFGPEMLDLAQRAARHAVSPELAQLREENQQLHDEVGRAAKLALDQALDAHIPDWRQINGDPRFHAWLLLPETYSGVIRDRLLKDAAAAGDASRLINFFRGFLREQGGVGQPAQGGSRRAVQPSGQRIYDRAEIVRMWARRRKGQISDEAWGRWEAELCRASKEGRVRGALSLDDGIAVSR